MTYGTTNGVASLARRWVDGSTGKFTGATNPTLAEVGSWLQEITTMIDVQLIDLGFTTPVEQEDVARLLGMFAQELAAARVEAVHGGGRLSEDDSAEVGFMAAWARDILEFVRSHAEAFATLGVPRRTDSTQYYRVQTVGA